MTMQVHVEQYLKALAELGIGYSYPGQPEALERDFLEKYLVNVDAPTVFDVGCHVGAYTRTVKEISPKAKVYAFEPHPKLRSGLASLEAMNDVHVFELALGDKEGEADFYDCIDQEGSPLSSLHKNVIEDLHGKKSRRYKVQVATLDRIVEDLQISEISLLKVDAEGNEFAVFKGAERTLRSKKIAVLQFEFNDMNVMSRTYLKDFYDYLSDYRLARLTPHGALIIEDYIPILHEVMALQTIVGFRKDLF